MPERPPYPSFRSFRSRELPTALVLAVSVVWLGGATPESAPWRWGLLAAAVCIRILDTGGLGLRVLGWSLPFWGWLLWSSLAPTTSLWEAQPEWLCYGGVGLCVFLGFSVRDARPVWTILLGLLAVGTAVAFVQSLAHPHWLPFGREQAPQYWGRASSFFGNPNQWAAFVLLLVPLLGTLLAGAERPRWLRILSAYLLLASLASLALTQSRGAALALAAVVLGALLKARWFRSLLVALVAGLVVLASVEPWRERWLLALAQGGETARSLLWSAAWRVWREHPWTGTGPGGFPAAFETLRPAGFVDQPQWLHSDWLQLAVELGLVGVALGALMVVGIWIQTGRAGGGAAEREAAAAGWGVFGFALAAAVDFHLHVPGTAWVAGWLTGYWLGRKVRLKESLLQPRFADRLVAVGALVSATLLTLVAVRWTRVENERAALRRAWTLPLGTIPQREDRVAALRAGIDRLQSLSALHPEAWPIFTDLSHYQSTLALVEPAASAAAADAERTARHALLLAPARTETWLALGVSLGQQGRREEAGTAFEQALQRAPRSPRAWYHYGFFLAGIPGAQHLALAAIENCLHLDPTYAEAQALHQQLSSVR